MDSQILTFEDVVRELVQKGTRDLLNAWPAGHKLHPLIPGTITAWIYINVLDDEDATAQDAIKIATEAFAGCAEDIAHFSDLVLSGLQGLDDLVESEE